MGGRVRVILSTAWTPTNESRSFRFGQFSVWEDERESP
jgi:hypothetical protein